MLPGKALYKFPFKNVGSAPLKVFSIDASCSCTATVIGPTEVAPGAGSEIEIKHSAQVLGKRTYVVTVSSNDPERPNVYLRISRTVVQPVVAMPKAVAFGTLSPGDSTTATVTLYHSRHPLMPCLDVAASSALHPSLAVEVGRVVTRVDAREQILDSLPVRLRFTASEALGKFSGEVRLRSNVHIQPEVHIKCHATVRPEIVAYPERAFFGLVVAGRGAQRQLTLRSLQARPFRVTGCKRNTRGLELSYSESRVAAAHTITVHLRGDHPPGVIRGKLAVRTDRARLRPVSIPIYAWVQ